MGYVCRNVSHTGGFNEPVPLSAAESVISNELAAMVVNVLRLAWTSLRQVLQGPLKGEGYDVGFYGQVWTAVY